MTNFTITHNLAPLLPSAVAIALNNSGIQRIFLILTLCFVAQFSFAQSADFDEIRISHISYMKDLDGRITKQLKIDLDSNIVYARKGTNHKFKAQSTAQDLSLFHDSEKLATIKEISKSLTESGGECLYHNEYGYYKIELIQLNYRDEIYTESFLINSPYECEDENNIELVRAYRELIIDLFKQR